MDEDSASACEAGSTVLSARYKQINNYTEVGHKQKHTVPT